MRLCSTADEGSPLIKFFEVIKEKQNLKSTDIWLLNCVEQELSVPQVGVKVMKKILCFVVVFGIACLGVFSRKYHCNMNISFLGFNSWGSRGRFDRYVFASFGAHILEGIIHCTHIS